MQKYLYLRKESESIEFVFLFLESAAKAFFIAVSLQIVIKQFNTVFAFDTPEEEFS